MKLHQSWRLELAPHQRAWLRERCLLAYKTEQDGRMSIWLVGISDTLYHAQALQLSAYNLRRLKLFVQNSVVAYPCADAAEIDRVLSEKLFNLLPSWDVLDSLIQLEAGAESRLAESADLSTH